jgi:hypothetical protein
MAIYAIIGIVVVSAIFAAGATWVVRNVTFKPMKRPYDYTTDRAENEYVQDDSKDEQNAPKT